MQLTGQQHIGAPRARVWAALNDPEVLRQCIPGCQSLEKVSEDKFNAIVNIKVGPIGARFNGAVLLSELDPPRFYVIAGEGQGGAAGFAKGRAKINLDDDGGATVLRYEVEAQVGGRLAQLGGPIIDATAKQLAGSFFKRFGEIVAPAQTAEVAAGAAPAHAAQSGAAQAPKWPVAWVLALVASALAGFLIGGASGATSNWAAPVLCALIIAVAAAGYEFGRRAAAPIITLDAEMLKRVMSQMSGEGR